MDSTAPSLDFAVIGHQDNWQNITDFVDDIRSDQERLSSEQIKNIFPFIPPRDLFRVSVKSKTGAQINGVYIDVFIDPDKLDTQFIKTNISKVKKAIAYAIKMGPKIVALGGFTSIVLEGKLDSFSTGETKFTTGNSLAAVYIVKGIEKASSQLNINLLESELLIIGATGDIGLACTNYLKSKVKKLHLCARNNQQLEKLTKQLSEENIQVNSSVSLPKLVSDADVILSVASSTGIKLRNFKKNVLICDAGYPKNIEEKIEHYADVNIFHGGMGQVSQGYTFSPDYSNTFYHYAAPYVIHGCILEAMILAFENEMIDFSTGRGNITVEKMEYIYSLSLKHGIIISPFYNMKGLWKLTGVV